CTRLLPRQKGEASYNHRPTLVSPGLHLLSSYSTRGVSRPQGWHRRRRMTIIRQIVSDIMVRVHLVDLELAVYHVGKMTDDEVWDRFHYYPARLDQDRGTGFGDAPRAERQDAGDIES